MKKFFFKRKKKEDIEPATSGEISEAELLKDVKKIQKESRVAWKEGDVELRKTEYVPTQEQIERGKKVIDKAIQTMPYSKEAEKQYRPEKERAIDWIDEDKMTANDFDPSTGEEGFEEPDVSQDLGEFVEQHPIVTPIVQPPVNVIEVRRASVSINIDADNLKKELNKLKDKENEWPDVANKISMNEIWIDSTPDTQYALRILKAYRRRCDERWMVEGFPKERRLLYDAMNAHQEQRAKELDRAIALLEMIQK